MKTLKIVLVGSCGSGKTTIANYLYNPDGFKVSIYRPTVGVRILEFEKVIAHKGNVGGEKFKIELWDMSGDISYENCWNSIRKDADGIIFVANSDQSFKKQEYNTWIKYFAKDINIKPLRCLAFSHFVTGKINEDVKIKFNGLNFYPSCIEKAEFLIVPLFNKYLGVLVDELNKMKNN